MFSGNTSKIQGILPIPVGPLAVFLRHSFLWPLFGTVFGACMQNSKIFDFVLDILQKSNGRRERNISEKVSRIYPQNAPKKGLGERRGQVKPEPQNVSKKDGGAVIHSGARGAALGSSLTVQNGQYVKLTQDASRRSAPLQRRRKDFGCLLIVFLLDISP